MKKKLVNLKEALDIMAKKNKQDAKIETFNIGELNVLQNFIDLRSKRIRQEERNATIEEHNKRIDECVNQLEIDLLDEFSDLGKIAKDIIKAQLKDFKEALKEE